ncbi:MAG: hypothetical protein QMD09_09920, partial [Desulfatibacillaceae bacterium]|nr:hypothetical protein [Desulfatibacillaceae bacterium]
VKLWESPGRAGGLLMFINKILDDLDPMGIISMVRYAGVDIKNEYDPEAKEIANAIKNFNTLGKLAGTIKEVFDQYFYDPDVDEDIYNLSAYRIWNAWLVHNGRKPISIPQNLTRIPPPDCKPVIIVA